MKDGGKIKGIIRLPPVPPASEQILALKTDTPNTHIRLDNRSPVLLEKSYFIHAQMILQSQFAPEI